MPKKGPFIVAPLDGTAYAPGRAPVQIPDLEVRHYPNEYTEASPKTKFANLVRQLAGTFKKNVEKK
jgi:hypothetical protein